MADLEGTVFCVTCGALLSCVTAGRWMLIGSLDDLCKRPTSGSGDGDLRDRGDNQKSGEKFLAC